MRCCRGQRHVSLSPVWSSLGNSALGSGRDGICMGAAPELKHAWPTPNKLLTHRHGQCMRWQRGRPCGAWGTGGGGLFVWEQPGGMKW